MNWIIFKKNEKINALDIKTLDIRQIKEDVKKFNFRPVGFFGKQEFENVRLYVVLADDKKGEFYVTSALFSKEDKTYPCFSDELPQFHLFEREFYEQFNIEPVNHPWLKPVRINQENYEFFKMQGENIHEVSVGPIHAGVIEPGHFRFMCQGEKVYELEIMLGFQHRGIENMMLKNPSNRLAESISGDSAVAHNMAYSEVLETLSDTKIPEKAEIIRRVALEAERIAIHIGDMGAIAGDMAYLPGASIFGVTRTLIINTMLEITGSRFSRGLINTGGVNYDITNEQISKFIKTLNEVETTVRRTTDVMLKTSSCISRMEKTGVVSQETIASLGAVGMAARASGVNLDSRFDFCDILYKKYKKQEFNGQGDVYSRFKLRYKEILYSIKILKDLLEKLKNNNDILSVKPERLSSNSFALSITEGWRGEVIHIAITGKDGELIRYKIKDPSFNNWYVLSMAVRNNGISDFPLCNKSFNLSYSGFDL